MAELIASHPCPNCRITTNTWSTKGPASATLERRSKAPDWLEDNQRAVVHCKSCGESYEGKAVVVNAGGEEMFVDVVR